MRKMRYSVSMSRKTMKLRKTLMVLGMAAAVMVGTFSGSMEVSATTIKQAQDKVNQQKKTLDNINNKIDNLSDEQDLIEEEIADLNSEVLNMMTSIGMKEDEIAEKENDIAQKQIAISQANIEYNEAKQREEDQYKAMIQQIRFMYENGDTSMLALLLESDDFAQFLNKAEYIEAVYQYDQKVLEDYVAAKEEVQERWNLLESDKVELQADMEQLEEDKAYLQTLKDELDKQLEKKKQQSADFEAEIQSYRKQAEAAKKKLQEDEKALKKLQDEQKKKAAAAAAAAKKGSGSTAVPTVTGSGTGSEIASYACQFVGNPYVMGGTSLTNGTDCSGFTYSVYKHFGYSLPRTSFQQRSAGRGVSYSEAQPGDLICYDGHVAMYIGNGQIVHASNPSSGIKISNATYKTILAVRRIVG